ncbi:hypothetical protein BHAOGJBA_3468 [Methylobacterium hispanicum]|jgi:hypothetical protein|uniref:Uncharacterized protein n=1 Tax=Methylobacterium hispanicum TaxID=270350 RepID=A0AAV4ZP65_9HYPH|nr:hypothetical protein BHAOGJBA_3468 [Methylobacterium hispanicum]
MKWLLLIVILNGQGEVIGPTMIPEAYTKAECERDIDDPKLTASRNAGAVKRFGPGASARGYCVPLDAEDREALRLTLAD